MNMPCIFRTTGYMDNMLWDYESVTFQPKINVVTYILWFSDFASYLQDSLIIFFFSISQYYTSLDPKVKFS